MQKISAGGFSFEPPSRVTSFDHFVGAGEQLRRHFAVERPGGLEVNSNVRTSLVAALEVQQDFPL
jgi:hypothetical protein